MGASVVDDGQSVGTSKREDGREDEEEGRKEEHCTLCCMCVCVRLLFFFGLHLRLRSVCLLVGMDGGQEGGGWMLSMHNSMGQPEVIHSFSHSFVRVPSSLSSIHSSIHPSLPSPPLGSPS